MSLREGSQQQKQKQKKTNPEAEINEPNQWTSSVLQPFYSLQPARFLIQ